MRFKSGSSTLFDITVKITSIINDDYDGHQCPYILI